jgi:hydrogenase maturation protease
VLGVGNLLQKDDGVGIHAVRAFGRISPAGVLAADVGTNAWAALPLLEAADKVVVLDAMKAGGVPGSVYVSAIGDIRREPVRTSLHELDVVNVVATMKGRRPEIVVVAAEPQTVELGMELEPVVEAAVPRMVEAAMRLVQLWSGMHSASPSPPTDLSSLFPSSAGSDHSKVR